MYVHDFTVNKTAIIEETRCFVMVMDRNEIAPPRNFLDFIMKTLEDGHYELDLDEIQHDMMITHQLTKDDLLTEYGWVIGKACDEKIAYKLEPVTDEMASIQKFENSMTDELNVGRNKRSSNTEKSFKEISKFSINYKIVNYDIL